MDVLADALARLVTIEAGRSSSGPRPKAISCRVYKSGEDWPSFCLHFVNCVKATYGYKLPTDQRALNDACVTWLPSKLEPGTTLDAYEELENDIKNDWEQLEAALREAFANATEKEMFLGDPAYCKRNGKPVFAFKNDVMRLMNAYLSDLKRVPSEFQRQATLRFIEGQEDDELKCKLRFHCKREKNTIEEAYQYVVDWEASNVQTKLREGATSVTSGKELAIMSRPPSNTHSMSVASSTQGGAVGGSSNHLSDQRQLQIDVKQLQSENKALAAKSKYQDLKIQELSAKLAAVTDRAETNEQHIAQLLDKMDEWEKKVNSFFSRANQPKQAYNNSQANAQQTYPKQGQSQGQYRGGNGAVVPSISGGAGYVNHHPQPPTKYRQGVVGTYPAPTAALEAIAATATDDSQAQPSPPQQQLPEGAVWISPGTPMMGNVAQAQNSNEVLAYAPPDFPTQ